MNTIGNTQPPPPQSTRRPPFSDNKHKIVTEQHSCCSAVAAIAIVVHSSIGAVANTTIHTHRLILFTWTRDDGMQMRRAHSVSCVQEKTNLRKEHPPKNSLRYGNSPRRQSEIVLGIVRSSMGVGYRWALAMRCQQHARSAFSVGANVGATRDSCSL